MLMRQITVKKEQIMLYTPWPVSLMDLKAIKKGSVIRIEGEESLPFVLDFQVTKPPYKWQGEWTVTLCVAGYHGPDRYKLRAPDTYPEDMCKLFSYFEDNFICCVESCHKVG